MSKELIDRGEEKKNQQRKARFCQTGGEDASGGGKSGIGAGGMRGGGRRAPSQGVAGRQGPLARGMLCAEPGRTEVSLLQGRL